MRKSIIVSLIVTTLFSLSGCDWVRGQLGMPTSADLEAAGKREVIAVEDTLVRPVTDSVDSLKMIDSVGINAQPVVQKESRPGVQTGEQIPAQVKAQPLTKKSALTKRFYIIAGSFKDLANAQKMGDILKKNGYNPINLELKNGFMMVAAGAFDTEGEASKEIRFMLEKDFSPGDLWVYDANTNKHKTN